MIDLDRLLRLRLVVGRFGELDNARWWNTKGQLGRLGAAALRRGLPRTHHFAQARSVFAVAAERCADLFDPPDSVTLWRLPEEIEEEFDARWEMWLDRVSEWETYFALLEDLGTTDLAGLMHRLGLVGQADLEALGKLRRSAERRAVPLPQPFAASDAQVTLLALGFARGEPGSPAVPYARRA